MHISLFLLLQCKVLSDLVFEVFTSEQNTADIMIYICRANLCIVLFITLNVFKKIFVLLVKDFQCMIVLILRNNTNTTNISQIST